MKTVLAVVVALALSLGGCSSDSNGTHAAAKAASGPHIPDGPLGAQIKYAIEFADGSVAAATYAAHFSTTFLVAAPPSKLDEVASQLKPAAPYRLDHFLEGPTATSGVLIIKSVQGSKLKMSITISANTDHLIEGLLFQPYGV